MKHKNLPTIHHRPHQRAGYPLPTTSYLLPTKKAYTIIELLTVLAIMLVVAAMMAPTFGTFRRSVRLRSVTRIIANNLITARSMAITQRAIYTAYIVHDPPNLLFQCYIREDTSNKTVGKVIDLNKIGARQIRPRLNPPQVFPYSVRFKFTGGVSGAIPPELFITDGKNTKSITVTNTTGRVKIKN